MRRASRIPAARGNDFDAEREVSTFAVAGFGHGTGACWGAASTWVFTIVRNKHIDMLRRERRPEVKDEDLESHVSSDRPLDEAYGVAQASDRLHAMLKKLSPEQALVLQKSYFEHMSHSDIAQALDLPLGTVKSRIRLALGSLRTALGENAQ